MSRPWLLVAFLALPLLGRAQEEMTEILYQDTEAGAAPYSTRVLIWGDRLRMDYGRDEDQFILYDRKSAAVQLVDPEARLITVIPVGQAVYRWPEDWRLDVSVLTDGANRLTRVSVNGALCAEFRAAPLLAEEAHLLADFRHALAANQAASWTATPQELRDPCILAWEVREAGMEYREGILLSARYADGRSRFYQRHARRPVDDKLFALPDGYRRFVVESRP